MAIDVGLKLQYEDLKKALEMAEQLDALLANLGKGYNLKLNTSSVSSANRQLSSLEQSAQRVESAFKRIGNAISTVGGGMQGLGNVFGGKVVNTVKTMATAFGTMGLYSAAQGTVQRYDTMRMFPKQMELLGFNADQSAKAVDKLEQSVIGLPTGLDEIVESARQLVTLTGDLERGSDLAIAANNALLAGGGDAQQRTWGQRQIRDLLSAGKLRSQEWESLIKALGPGLKDIGEEMGYADYGKFRTELKANKIEAEDFLDALVKVGTGEGVLAQRADLYKDTLSATAKNIKNAVQKLGAAGLDKLGEVLKEKTGKDLPQTIVGISDAIKQKLVPALEGWIEDNGDKIVDFIDRLKNYDWIGLVSKVAEGLAKYYDLISGFLTKLSPDLIAFLSVWGSPIGRALQTFGGFVSGLSGPVGKLIRVFGKGSGKAIDAAASGVGKVANIAGSVKNAFAGLGLAAGFTAEVALIGGVVYEYAKIIESISNMNFGPNFGKNIDTISLFAGTASGIAGGLTALFSGLTQIGFGPAIAGGEALTGGFLLIIEEIGRIIKEYAKIVNYIAGMNVPEESKIKDLGKTIVALNDNVLKKVKKVPNSKVTYLSRLTEMTEYVADIASSLKKLRGVGDIGDMSGMIDSIGKSLDAILDLDYDRQDKKRSKKISKTLKFLSDSTSSISDVVANLVSMKSNVSQLIKRGDATELNNVVSGFTNIATKTIDSLKGMQFGTGEVKTANANLKVVSEAVASIGQIVSTLVSSQGGISQLIKKDHGHTVTSFGDNLVAILDSLIRIVGSYQLDTQKYDTAALNLSKLAAATASIGELTSSLATAQASMSKVGDPATFFSNIMPILNVARVIAGLVKRLNIATDGEAAMKLKALAEATGHIPAIVDALKQAKESISGLGIGKDGTWKLGEDIKTIVNTLTQAFAGGTGEENFSQAVSLETAATNLAAIVEQLKALGDNAKTVADNLKKAAEQLGKFGEKAGENKGKIQDVATAVGNLRNNLQGISSGGSGAASGITALGNAASDNIGAIGLAASAAARLAAAIKSIPSYKSINIQAGGSSIGWARQNIPGFASGGEVHGPSGIDRVRSWLTAGEFVMTKRAHSKFGTAFMNRINNLDVDGAIRALSIRAGAGMRRGGMVTNNYSRDSHSNFTFNINRASQGFTQRRASKWARAFS